MPFFHRQNGYLLGRMLFEILNRFCRLKTVFYRCKILVSICC